jgi:hypothetical protein
MLQAIEHRCRLTKCNLSADQIVEETSDWPEDAVADPVDRILRAKYGEVDASADASPPLGRRFYDEITSVFRRIIEHPLRYKQFDPPARRWIPTPSTGEH